MSKSRKKTLDYPLYVLASIVVTIISVAAVTLWFNASNGESSFRANYPKVPANHIFKTIDADATKRMLRSGTGVLFLGFPACPWCQGLSPYLNDSAKKAGIKEISYFDIRSARADNDQNYQDIVKILEPNLDKDESGQPRVYVPHVVIVKDGKVIGNYKLDLTAGDGESPTPDNYWTDERAAKARQQMADEFKKLN